MKKEKFGMILNIALFAYFLIIMDNSIIFTSSSEIGQSLNLTGQDLSWVSNAYTLTFGGFLLLSGRLSDLLGRKTIFLIALSIFGLSSLFIGLADSSWLLIMMRALQGIGSSILAPSTLAFMMDAYHGEKRQRAIAYYGATAGIGSTLGLIIGGGLTTLISWRTGFLINVPFTFILFFLTIKYIKPGQHQKVKIDYLGSVLSVLGLATFIYAFVGSQFQVILLVVSIVCIGIFLWRENHISYPIMPLVLFENRVRTGAYLVRLLFMMAMLPYWFLVPQMLQSQFNFSALQSGLAFMPLTVVHFILSMNLPKFAAKFGNAKVMLVGETMIIIGFVVAATVDLSSGYWLAFGIPMLILGVQGLVLAPVTYAGVYQTTDDLAGAASSLTNAAHQIGGPIGLSLILALTDNYHYQLLLMAGFTTIALFIVLFFILPTENKERRN